MRPKHFLQLLMVDRFNPMPLVPRHRLGSDECVDQRLFGRLGYGSEEWYVIVSQTGS
jgi:hypothetical protein